MIALQASPKQRPISVATAAQQLDVSPQTIRRRIKEGLLPAYRVGRLLKIDPADLERITRPTDTGERDAA